MARQRESPPGDILDAIAEHLADWHDGLGVDLAEVGKLRSRAPSIQVIWHDGVAWTDAWFLCRRCREGFRRYLVEVDRDQPTRRMLRLVAAHFAVPGHPPFRGREDLGTRDRPHRDQLAFYVPPHAEAGASLICQTCKRVGRNPVGLTPPPYGDARRLRLVQRRRSDLTMRMLEWKSEGPGGHSQRA